MDLRAYVCTRPGVPVEEKGSGSPKASKTQVLRWCPGQVRLSAQVQYKVHRAAVLALCSEQNKNPDFRKVKMPLVMLPSINKQLQK